MLWSAINMLPRQQLAPIWKQGRSLLRIAGKEISRGVDGC